MKIIHVITSFGIGGAEKLLLNVINQQIEEHEVYLIYLKPIDDLIHLIDDRVQVKNIVLSFTIISKLKTYFKTINPDIIHTHLGHADLLGMWSARNVQAKVFCTMHNIYFKKNMLDILFFKMYSYLFKNKNIDVNVIAISKAVNNHVVDVLKLPIDKSYLLYNAIPFKKIEKRKGKGDKTHLLFVGRLEKQKSISTLLKAISHINNNEIEVTIVGDGKLKTELQQQVLDLGLNGQVTFEGKQKDTDKYYKSADIFILPSIWEGFGIVILEAFRAKLAVIASNIEGPAELIKHANNGLLFEPENYIDLANKITMLFNDKKLRGVLSVNGFNTFSENFHIEPYVKRLNDIYINA
ncbi:glycosyltransferase family 4 protein [Tenacibaculum halocynthiae]|uniref:glycosyltransferase family 4 protein n=1 Tax=Tenacibaculum halocynthiae TaxID=1254437 RepID=UPI003894A902